jgi:hypothetical protein
MFFGLLREDGSYPERIWPTSASAEVKSERLGMAGFAAFTLLVSMPLFLKLLGIGSFASMSLFPAIAGSLSPWIFAGQFGWSGTKHALAYLVTPSLDHNAIEENTARAQRILTGYLLAEKTEHGTTIDVALRQEFFDRKPHLVGGWWKRGVNASGNENALPADILEKCMFALTGDGNVYRLSSYMFTNFAFSIELEGLSAHERMAALAEAGAAPLPA